MIVLPSDRSSFDFRTPIADVQTMSPTGESRLPAYQRGSATSKAAAESIAPHVTEQQRIVFAWITAQGAHGGTQKEAEAALPIGRASLCPRFHELEKASRILKVGGRRRGGCAVYVAMKN